MNDTTKNPEGCDEFSYKPSVGFTRRPSSILGRATSKKPRPLVIHEFIACHLYVILMAFRWRFDVILMFPVVSKVARCGLLAFQQLFESQIIKNGFDSTG